MDLRRQPISELLKAWGSISSTLAAGPRSRPSARAVFYNPKKWLQAFDPLDCAREADARRQGSPVARKRQRASGQSRPSCGASKTSSAGQSTVLEELAGSGRLRRAACPHAIELLLCGFMRGAR